MPGIRMSLHVGIVLSMLIVILARPRWSWDTYTCVVAILLAQLYFVCAQYSRENFEAMELRTIDTDSIAKLAELPDKVEKPITDGLQDLVSTVDTKDEISTISAQQDRYASQDVRMAYKHIDYLLEKIRTFNKAAYTALVPQFSQEVYDRDREETKNAMKNGERPPPCPGEEQDE